MGREVRRSFQEQRSKENMNERKVADLFGGAASNPVYLDQRKRNNGG